MLLFDLSLRVAALTIIMIAFCLSLLQARHIVQGRIGAMMCLSLAALMVHTMPEEMGVPASLGLVAWWLHGPALIFFWWFGLSLFDDHFSLRWYHWAVVGIDYVLECVLPLTEVMESTTPFYIIFGFGQSLNMAIMIHLFFAALAGRDDDLVATRRSSRLFFILAAVAITMVLMNGEAVHYVSVGKEEEIGWLSLLRAGLILPISIFAFGTFIRLKIDLTLLSAGSSHTAERMISPQDRGIHTKLMHLIETYRIYLEPGLSIGALAERIRVPEHQLRSLINHGLGYRNFTSFLNTYRLADAKAALADPEMARTPILRIATNAGYASLATFNRAFKASEDMTPREYRMAALENLVHPQVNPISRAAID